MFFPSQYHVRMGFMYIGDITACSTSITLLTDILTQSCKQLQTFSIFGQQSLPGRWEVDVEGVSETFFLFQLGHIMLTTGIHLVLAQQWAIVCKMEVTKYPGTM